MDEIRRDDKEQEYKFAIDLAQKLDSKPFSNVRCMGEQGCTNVVRYLSLYKGQYNGNYFFCGSCDPYIQGAMSGTLGSRVSIVSDSYGKQYREDILNAVAEAKGLTGRRTEKKLKEFFGY